MYMLLNALILALLLPPGGAQRKANDGPACRARLEGMNLLTTVALPTGMLVEGPWRIMHNGEMKEGQAQFVLIATLDRVIERDVMTGEHRVTRFPEAVSLAFEGADPQDLVQRAANVWCVTVMKAQENRALDRVSPNRANLTRIALAGGSGPRA